MAESNRNSPKKFFDVAKPNKSRPSPTTKQVIVTNRPILQDPMVNAVPNQSGPTTAPPLEVKLATKINVRPLSTSAELAASEPIVVKPVTEVSDSSDLAGATSPISDHIEQARAEAAVSAESEAVPVADSAEPPVATTDEPALKSGTVPIAEAPKDGALVTAKDLVDDEDEADEAAANIQKLVVEKRYFLPINTQEKRRTKHFIILGIILILLLALAWANIALDAGLIRIDGVKPLTHLFSN